MTTPENAEGSAWFAPETDEDRAEIAAERTTQENTDDHDA